MRSRRLTPAKVDLPRIDRHGIEHPVELERTSRLHQRIVADFFACALTLQVLLQTERQKKLPSDQ